MDFRLAHRVDIVEICVRKTGDNYECCYCSFRATTANEVAKHLVEHAIDVQYEQAIDRFLNVGQMFNCPRCDDAETNPRFFAGTMSHTKCQTCNGKLETPITNDWWLDIESNIVTWDIQTFLDELYDEEDCDCDYQQNYRRGDVSNIIAICNHCDCHLFCPSSCTFGVSDKLGYAFTCNYCGCEIQACLECVDAHLNSHNRIYEQALRTVNLFKLTQAQFAERATYDAQTGYLSTLAVPEPVIEIIASAIVKDIVKDSEKYALVMKCKSCL